MSTYLTTQLGVMPDLPSDCYLKVGVGTWVPTKQEWVLGAIDDTGVGDPVYLWSLAREYPAAAPQFPPPPPTLTADSLWRVLATMGEAGVWKQVDIFRADNHFVINGSGSTQAGSHMFTFGPAQEGLLVYARSRYISSAGGYLGPYSDPSDPVVISELA